MLASMPSSRFGAAPAGARQRFMCRTVAICDEEQKTVLAMTVLQWTNGQGAEAQLCMRSRCICVAGYVGI